MKTEIDNNFSFDLPKNKSNVMKVMGVGGGGSNAVNHMFQQGITGVDFIVCNTDSQALDKSPVPNKIQLGVNITEGLGAGANPEIGKLAALETHEELRDLLETQTKMLFITAGMGGGTGTGAAPIIAEFAKELDILTVGIVTIPFDFEGKTRQIQAQKGLKKLKKTVDSLIIINNNKLRQVYGNLGFKEGFSKADEVLATAAKGIAQVITHHYTQNIDLKDAKTVLANSGTAIMGSATSSGSNRANDAVIKALDSPLLNDNKIDGSKNVLLLIVSGSDEITIDEIGEINEYVQKETGNTANIIMGVGEDQELGNNISVTVIATGFAEDQQNNLVNSETKKVIYTLDEDQTIEKKLIEEEDNISDNEVETIRYDSNYNISKDNQIKIDSQINEILRDIEVEYERVEYEMIDNELINEIEVFDIEEVSSGNIENNQSNEDKITDGLFSEKLDLESVSESVEFVKLDLDEEETIENEISENEDESMNNENITLDQDISIEINNENNHAFENPIDVDPLDENRLRRESLKKYNYVFKDGNSSVEDLEKEPAYKRMGIQIKNNINNHEVESKTVLNENNEIEFPEPNTYLHDNVD
ncbi:MAG TPA: cell division protein FtsZ [Flavobacteriaceae bacterium]|jgi:cell division protein FtsZ|nr:cell division protein FtsZ [Flavobacteriaceae bacterium]HJO70850.1 cell division protein FtsZ [Flavobacteriaceae bacterium]|tara:strand:- start:10336 stop:12105 length:1770 start_codon:yes stop_codon:yes gene_type:complete